MKNPESCRRTPNRVSHIPQFRHGGNVYAFARARDVTPERVLDFSASINPLGWPPGAANAYRQALHMVRERAWLFEQLAALKSLRPFPSQANFLLVRIITSALSVSRLVRALARENLLIRTCADFPGLGERFFRVAVRRRQENRRLLNVLHTVLPQG